MLRVFPGYRYVILDRGFILFALSDFIFGDFCLIDTRISRMIDKNRVFVYN